MVTKDRDALQKESVEFIMLYEARKAVLYVSSTAWNRIYTSDR